MYGLDHGNREDLKNHADLKPAFIETLKRLSSLPGLLYLTLTRSLTQAMGLVIMSGLKCATK